MHFSTSTIVSSLLLLVTSSQAFTLTFYLGTECNGEETATYEISTPDMCSVSETLQRSCQARLTSVSDNGLDHWERRECDHYEGRLGR